MKKNGINLCVINELPQGMAIHTWLDEEVDNSKLWLGWSWQPSSIDGINHHYLTTWSDSIYSFYDLWFLLVPSVSIPSSCDVWIACCPLSTSWYLWGARVVPSRLPATKELQGLCGWLIPSINEGWLIIPQKSSKFWILYPFIVWCMNCLLPFVDTMIPSSMTPHNNGGADDPCFPCV